MDEQKYLEINKVIDKALDEFLENKSSNEEVFKNSSERKGFYFSLVREYEKSYQKPQKCMYPGCDSQSIIYSHSLQRGGGIQIISENSHVYWPVFDERSGKMRIEKIGINKASTFPGFCNKHEGVFSVFENKKEIEYENEIKLQIYRTLCRELQVRRIELANNIKRRDEYLSLQNKRFAEILSKHLVDVNFDITIKDIDIKREDFRLYYMNKEIDELEERVSFIRKKYYYPFSKDIQKGTNNIFYKAIKLDHVVPVCLAGAGYISYTKRNKKTKALIIMNVFPQDGATLIILATDRNSKAFLERYISHYSQSALMALDLIESWMVHVTDHWFVKPSIWETLSEKRREKILSDILDIRFGVLDTYGLSIFDDIRKYMLTIIDTEDKWDKNDETTVSFLMKERDKLRDEETYSIFPTTDILKLKGYMNSGL